MPRRARMYIPGLPYHIVQRGNNRDACFIEPANYQFYLDLWQEISKRYGVAVHAYDRDEYFQYDEGSWKSICTLHQPMLCAQRHFVGRTASPKPGSIRPLPIGMLPIH